MAHARASTNQIVPSRAIAGSTISTGILLRNVEWETLRLSLPKVWCLVIITVTQIHVVVIGAVAEAVVIITIRVVGNNSNLVAGANHLVAGINR